MAARITTEGLNHLLAVALDSTTAKLNTWYVGLVTDPPTFAAGDTLGAHAGWTEFTSYTGNRKEYVDAAPSGGVVTNSASKAVFAINGSGTVAGAFVGSAETGTTGTLLGEGEFSAPGDRAVASGDTLNVTVTVTLTTA